MKRRTHSLTVLLLGSLLSGIAHAASDESWLAEARKNYPLTTCVISGEPVENNDMGGPFDYVHKEEGKADRLVRFCCEGCVKRFKRDPQKYLSKIDEAASQGAQPAPKPEKKPDHNHHS